MSPAVRGAETPPQTLSASKGCSVSSLGGCAKFVADKLLSKVVALEEEEKEEGGREQSLAEASLQSSVSHNVKL